MCGFEGIADLPGVGAAKLAYRDTGRTSIAMQTNRDRTGEVFLR